MLSFQNIQTREKNHVVRSVVIDLLTTLPVMDKRCFLPKIEEVDIRRTLAQLNIHLVKKFVKHLEKVNWF